MKMLKLNKKPKYLDATDGLAVAVCHALQNDLMIQNKKESWSQFIKNNPKRVS